MYVNQLHTHTHTHICMNVCMSTRQSVCTHTHTHTHTRRRPSAGELILANWWCCRRCLRVPWTARRPNQSILKEINPEYSSEGLMLKLKLQYLATWWEDLTYWKRSWCWGRLKAGGEGDGRGWDGWMASPTWWTWVWADSGREWRRGEPGVLPSMESQRVGHELAMEQHNNYIYIYMCVCVCVCVHTHTQAHMSFHCLTFLQI